MNQEKVIVIDFGGQYNQLVARRVRECNVYCEIYSYKTPLEQIKAMNPKGIILTGGPNSCYEEGSPTCTKELFELGVPVLGLCYGAQLMQHVLGGKVEKAPVREPTLPTCRASGSYSRDGRSAGQCLPCDRPGTGSGGTPPAIFPPRGSSPSGSSRFQ